MIAVPRTWPFRPRSVIEHVADATGDDGLPAIPYIDLLMLDEHALGAPVLEFLECQTARLIHLEKTRRRVGDRSSWPTSVVSLNRCPGKSGATYRLDASSHQERNAGISPHEKTPAGANPFARGAHLPSRTTTSA